MRAAVGGAVCWVVRARGVRVRPGVQAEGEGETESAPASLRRDVVNVR